MRQFDDPWSHPTNDVRVIRTIQGKLAAFLRIYVDPKPIEERFAFIRCLIAPEARSQGLEEASIEWMEARAKQRLAEIVHAASISPALFVQKCQRALRKLFNVTKSMVLLMLVPISKWSVI